MTSRHKYIMTPENRSTSGNSFLKYMNLNLALWYHHIFQKSNRKFKCIYLQQYFLLIMKNCSHQLSLSCDEVWKCSEWIHYARPCCNASINSLQVKKIPSARVHRSSCTEGRHYFHSGVVKYMYSINISRFSVYHQSKFSITGDGVENEKLK